MRTPAFLVFVALAGSAASAQNATLEKARALAAELAQDAASRTSLRDDGGVGGYRNGRFFLSDQSGTNVLNFGGSLTARYLASFRSGDAPLTDDSAFTHGFQNQLFRLRMTGTLGREEISYKFVAGYGLNGTPRLTDGWAAYKFGGGGWMLKAGQFRPMLLREENVDEELGLLVDRSQTNEYFTPDWSQGLELSHTGQQTRFFVGFMDGYQSPFQISSANTEFNSPDEADYAVHARAEWMFSGSDWTRFDKHTSWRGTSSYAGMLGAAIAYQSFGSTGATTPAFEATDLTYTVDASVQGNGWNALVAFIGNQNEPDAFAGTTDFGFVAQGGYFLTNQLELVGRYNVLMLDEDGLLIPGADDVLNFISAGVNYYIVPESTSAKLSADVVYSMNATDGLIDTSIGDLQTGLLGDPSEGEIDFRLQVLIRF